VTQTPHRRTRGWLPWLAAGLLACSPAPPAADLVLRGGVVTTLDRDGSIATAVAVRAGDIVAVGDDSEIGRWIAPTTEVIELAGRSLLPAFQDAHVHPLAGGVELGECDLNPRRDAADVLAGIAECAVAMPEGWLRGGGYQLPYFPGGKPTAALLDSVVADRPAFITSADGHSAWVNSRALAEAEIDASTPDPPRGRIERAADGRTPAGTLREAAVDLVAERMPPHTPAEFVAGLRRGLAMANGFGITAWQEASADRAALEAYDALERAGELTARVSVSMLSDPARGTEQIADFVAWRRELSRPGLRVETVKIFADGVIEGQTAALLEPYLGMGDFRGIAEWEPQAMTAFVVALDAAGFQVHVHAIGDRAIRMALDAFAEARRVNGVRDSRHHIAHAQLIDPADIPRFGALGVFANFQPLWAYADTYITDLTEPFLGPERSRWLYPMRSVRDAGGTLVFGSDWSVSSMNPLLGIQVGILRTDPDGPDGVPWLPQERLDLDAMLRGYTVDAARVNFLDDVSGSIEVGKLADLIVLDRDLTTTPPDRIGEARVLLTLLAGEPVFRSGI
jgi:predicted amidohydrolase YtcJ